MKITTEQFIERATTIHGDLYSYVNTRLNGMNNKVTITCKKHGDFEQRAASHLDGSGCRLCKERQRLTKPDFIAKAMTVHGSKYTYDSVAYKNVTTKVTITCPEHGDFSQTPKDHMRGYGCPSCGGTKPVSKNDFIQRAVQTHGDTYDYSKLTIAGMNGKGTIICKIHGEFEQRLADHLAGSGCYDCSLSKRGQYSAKFFNTFPDEKNTPAILYLAVVDGKFCKVGITKRNVSKRFGNKNVRSVCEVKLPLFEAYVQEQEILDMFKHDRYKALGLTSRHFVGWTECFPLELADTLKHEIQSRAQ